jgi:hypothetical protein
MTMFSAELDKLLVQHIADLDEGARRLELLQSKIAEIIDDLCGTWISSAGWIRGDETWLDDVDTSLAPPHWVDTDRNWLARFHLDYATGDDGDWSKGNDYFWLTRLCREGRGQMGFRFAQGEFGKTQWKKFLQKKDDRFAGTRFILDDQPSLFLPVKVDRDVLAKGAEEDDFTEALKPIVDALDYIRELAPRFDEMRKDMLEQQAS